MKALAAIALSATGVGRHVVEQATRYEQYLTMAQTCGVDVGRAKAIFEEEVLKPGDFDGALRRAKERVTLGAA